MAMKWGIPNFETRTDLVQPMVHWCLGLAPSDRIPPGSQFPPDKMPDLRYPAKMTDALLVNIGPHL